MTKMNFSLILLVINVAATKNETKEHKNKRSDIIDRAKFLTRTFACKN